MAGVNACIRNWSTVTNVAITTIYTGIWTLSGTAGAMAEMAILERMSTNSVAKPMLSPLIADEVVANVGHIPRISTNVGLSLTSPFVMSCNLVIVVSSYSATGSDNVSAPSSDTAPSTTGSPSSCGNVTNACRALSTARA